MKTLQIKLILVLLELIKSASGNMNSFNTAGNIPMSISENNSYFNNAGNNSHFDTDFLNRAGLIQQPILTPTFSNGILPFDNSSASIQQADIPHTHPSFGQNRLQNNFQQYLHQLNQNQNILSQNGTSNSTVFNSIFKQKVAVILVDRSPSSVTKYQACCQFPIFLTYSWNASFLRARWRISLLIFNVGCTPSLEKGITIPLFRCKNLFNAYISLFTTTTIEPFLEI